MGIDSIGAALPRLGKVGSEVVLRRKSGEDLSTQVYDCFEDYFPPSIEQQARELNQCYPLASLRLSLSEGRLSMGQWLLYTCVCFNGQVVNGGLEGFFGNSPGLIVDVERMLDHLRLETLLESYRKAAAPLLDVVSAYGDRAPFATGDQLNDFYREYELAEDQLDPLPCESIEAAAYASDRESNILNEFRVMETRVLEYVLQNPLDFQSSDRPSTLDPTLNQS